MERHGRLAAFLCCAAAVTGVAACSSGPHTDGAQVSHVTFDSRYVHHRMRLTLVAPAGGGTHRPLLVFLHGLFYDSKSQLSDQLFSALHDLGRRAPDIVFPAGDHSWWHNRASGAWGSYVLDEVIPRAVSMLHADPHRLAIGGISMGGFGAYALARLEPGRFCAVGGHSAAIYPAFDVVYPGAFDNARDFARNDLLTAGRSDPTLYGHAQLWLDGGAADPFHTADEQFARALHIHMHVWPGSHDFGYWNAHWKNYLSFYSNALANCR